MKCAQRLDSRCAIFMIPDFQNTDLTEVRFANHKYARIERERRYLLHSLPSDLDVRLYRDIVDRYLIDTRLRLREIISSSGSRVWKLTQKYPATSDDPINTVITNLYLSAEEFALLCALPARQVAKRRYVYEYAKRRYAIDVFQGLLTGLILAETECETAEECAGLLVPDFAVRDVSYDARFTGGALAQATGMDFLR